jgi:FMN-dependent oxidoreductase (nitrilotriacetate monooxygenase family)
VSKPIKLTLVEQGGPSADSALWHHPDFEPELFKKPAFWSALAGRLETAGFDAIFFADTPAIRADTPDQRRHALATGGGTRLDPAFIIPIMAAVTERLGFVVTTSVSYDAPFTVARKFSTLDHLTKGRIGWNVVTNNVRSAARNHGLDDQLPHDTRYDRADAFMDVVYALWNRSWEDGAALRDTSRNLYADPGLVHRVDHQSDWFTLAAIHMAEPSPQRTPVLFQAGSSARGRTFGATHDECIYLNATSVEETARLVGQIRALAQDAGRSPDHVKFMPRIIPVVAETEKKAAAKYNDFVDACDPEAALIVLQQWAGIDLRGRDPNEPVDFETLDVATGNSQHTGDFLRRIARDGQRFTVKDLLRAYAFGGAGNVTAGTPAQIADKMETYIDQAGVDGFNIAYMIRGKSVDEFIDLVVPELRRRGRLPAAGGPTLRERLFGEGPTLPSDHPGHRDQALPGTTTLVPADTR